MSSKNTAAESVQSLVQPEGQANKGSSESSSAVPARSAGFAPSSLSHRPIDDFDRWIASIFVTECARGQNIPHIAVKPIRHQTNITPEQAGRLIGHIARLIGDVPLEMLCDRGEREPTE